MTSGKILYIDRYHREDDLVTLFLSEGGEVTVSPELVANIVPNEIASPDTIPEGAVLVLPGAVPPSPLHSRPIAPTRTPRATRTR